MKVLPIVGRELRESSRRGGTYWMRAGVGMLALAIGIGSYAMTLVKAGATLGTFLFWGLAGVSMLYCLFAGRRSTADCVSQEKREGTLGLLFLTDLRGYDVILGKLAATSVTGLYALLAVIPMLAVPLLTGGMSRGEVERMVLVLVNTFFFSSAIGIFASTISREYRTAMAANFLLWLGIVGLPAGIGCGIGVARSLWIQPLFYSCPIFSFFMAADPNYVTWGVDYWLSIAVTAVLTCLLTVGACAIVPRTWGDKPPRKAPRRSWWRNDFNSLINYGPVEGRIEFRRNALNTNAYFWHAARARLKPVHVWLFIAFGTVWWFYCWIKEGHIWLDEMTYVFTAVVVNSAFKLWVALEAGQRLGEDRRSGAFELLLPTPLTVAEILRGQWLALRRQFLKPLLVVLVVEIVFVAIIRRTQRSGMVSVAMLVVLPFDLFALAWVSMLTALTAKSQVRATMQAVVRILILPWIFFGLLLGCVAIYNWLWFRSWNPSDGDETLAWLALSLGVDAIYGGWTWRALHRDFRQIATQNWKPVSWRILLNRAAAWFGNFVSRVPFRIKVPVGLALVVVVGAGLLMKAKPARIPPSIAIIMTQSNAPLQIFPAGSRGVLFILPDGSLWRWGKTGVRQNYFAATPEQVGTNHDWAKVVANRNNSFGLRTNGTIWSIGAIDETIDDELRLEVDGTNWADIESVEQHYSFAIKKDGTIWRWTPGGPVNSRTPERIGTASNWVAMGAHNSQYIGLRSDGTLWTWGTLLAGRNGTYWFGTNIEQPTLVCAETNWISLDSDALARNRAGEIWNVSSGLPKPNASVSAVGQRVFSRSVGYRIEAEPYRMNSELRTNGSLWIAPASGDSWNWAASESLSGASEQFGKRSDWIGLWGINGTAFGLTRDGTLWVWGYDLGRKAVVTATTRIQLVQAALKNPSGNLLRWDEGGLPPAILAEPRPLMKLLVK